MIPSIRLSALAIEAIRKHPNGIKSKLALALHCSEGSINRYLRENDDNLTKAAALEVIKIETGLQTHEILQASSLSTD